MSDKTTPENDGAEKNRPEAEGSEAVERQSYRVPVLNAVIAILLAVILTAIACMTVFFRVFVKESDDDDFLKKVRQLDAIYRSKFVGELDYDKITDALLYAYIAATDRYGYYLNADDYAETMNGLENNGVGFGIYVSEREDGIEIQLVMQNTPAERAGLQAGDVIYRVNDAVFADMTYDDFLAACKGKAGDRATLYYLRGGETHSVELTYENYRIQTIVSRELGNGVGYIYITNFEQDTPNEFKAAIETLKSAGCDRFVFDVRNNPGGLLDSVTDILDYIMGEGVIVTVVDSEGETVHTITSDDFDAIEGMPCAVVINYGSASAAELFSCALRDSKGAILVGETSFGKGTMQHIYSLGDGTGIGVTTNYYNPPVSPNFDGVGLTPDIMVGLSKEAAGYTVMLRPYELDTQLQAAVGAITKAD